MFLVLCCKEQYAGGKSHFLLTLRPVLVFSTVCFPFTASQVKSEHCAVAFYNCY